MTRDYPVLYDLPCSFRRRLSSWSKVLIFGLFVVIFVSSCTGSGGDSAQLSGAIQIDGSTALQPLVTLAAAAF